MTAVGAVAVAVGAMIAAVAVQAAPSAVPSAAGAQAAVGQSAAVPVALANAVPVIRQIASLPAQPDVVSLELTAADRRACPAATVACVDLGRHMTWMQAGGKVTFGPVQMEPGRPGSQHETPRGTFKVSWKAGPTFVSDMYHEPMPWATFFAPDGIAFHGGSLTTWSHGCVHLTLANAHYYNTHLPIGAQVSVF
jgi:hypothetical protein